MPQLTAREALNILLRRCVECPPDQQPSCPSCAPDETCSLTPQSCNACASTSCIPLKGLAGAVTESKPSKPIGPIVGGVLGGVAAVLVVTFCLWWFCLRPRKRKDTWEPPEKRDQSSLARAEGNRTHSIASTVLTRASNVIQIAYIPGVTGRSPPVSPGMPPPMPSIAGTANSTPQPDTHFFMADDLRNSTWSDTSIDPRISLAPSLARASSATTVYYENAIVPPLPAQPAMRAQANMVNVKQLGTPSASASTTPARSSPLAQGGKVTTINNSSIVARNVTARPIEVKKTGSGNRVPTLGNLARQNSTRSANTIDTSLSELPAFNEKEVVLSPVTDIVDSPTSTGPLRTKQSDMSLGANSISGISAVLPSDGPLARQSPATRPDSGGLTAMIEDAIKNASADARPSPRPGVNRIDSGPFSDIHELPSSGSP